ncbi:NIPSNAP family protein [Acidimangrovimonas sediminis]|uniref:NIPSNAP family protein n=1 Tax=Acidimangrovimonas sediminis TaxID=2056283 RepID=UPI000C805264|nr:NIPSNAP family protein [Acidimangrovimonas sediminis]
MIYELRSYDFDPAGAPRYLALFQSEGLPLVTRHLPLLGYWLTETGGLNRLHHLWVYRDLEDRAACRAGASRDKGWTQGFAPRAFPMIRRQTSCLMTLEVGSEALRRAEEAARRAHGPVAASAPVTGPGWAMLLRDPSRGKTGDEEGAVEPKGGGAGLVACWRVLSGVGEAPPGARIVLSRAAEAGGLRFPDRPARACELMRPTSFSPL